jgi:hypothetical protein
MPEAGDRRRGSERGVERRWLTGWTQWQPGERINNKCKRLTSISVWLPPPPPPSYPTLEIRHLLREEARRIQSSLYLVARLLTSTGLAPTNLRARTCQETAKAWRKSARHWTNYKLIQPPCLPLQSQTACCDGVYSRVREIRVELNYSSVLFPSRPLCQWILIVKTIWLSYFRLIRIHVYNLIIFSSANNRSYKICICLNSV